MVKSEIERLLAKYPNPRDVRYAPQLEGRGSELREQFPGTYGALGGLLGTAPDEFERGSVLSDSDSARDAAVKAGAEYGYPVGLAANLAPVFTGLGGLAAKYGPGIAKVVAKNAATPSTLSRQAGVIKAPGGNWLSGSVEDALKGLKRPTDMGNYDPPGVWQQAPEAKQSESLNSWIDKQLTRYVKNDMATERDPVRALAERGVLHKDFGFEGRPGLGRVPREERVAAGFPEKGFAQTEQGRGWENTADNLVRNDTAGEMLKMAEDKGYDRMLNKNPWLQKVPPETKLHEMLNYSAADKLGFTHLIDELRNATNPNSGLPAELLLKYDALDKVSVPQAVERVAKINEWRAAQKAEADMARANNAATVLHKEYPEQGMRWVELRAPDKPTIVEGEYKDPLFDIPQAQQDRFHAQAGREALRNGLDEESDDYMMAVTGRVQELASEWAAKNKPKVSKELQDALKYEGDTMGHCVGGYCDDVASGASRIYSLRDAKGRPHVTIEAKPGSFGGTDREGFIARANELGWSPEKLTEHMAKLDETGAFEPTIIQIKGKGNKKPNDEYLPFVQDFVKSGKWSHVGDIRNTGLVRAMDVPAKERHLFPQDKPFITEQEMNKIREDALARELDLPGYAKGGRVKAKQPHPCGCDTGYADGGFVQFDPTRVDSIVERLRAEFA